MDFMTSCLGDPGSILETSRDSGKTLQDHGTSKPVISEVTMFVNISRFSRNRKLLPTYAVGSESSNLQIWNLRVLKCRGPSWQNPTSTFFTYEIDVRVKFMKTKNLRIDFYAIVVVEFNCNTRKIISYCFIDEICDLRKFTRI